LAPKRALKVVSLTQYYTATTLDGLIADPDNSLDWLFTRKQEKDGPLNYGDFIAGIGAMAMGSTTYEWILDHEFAGIDPAEWKWPYDIPCWVFTHRQLPVVPDSRMSSPPRTSQACTRRWPPPPVTGTSGSSAGETWRVSSPTWAFWMRSSCR